MTFQSLSRLVRNLPWVKDLFMSRSVQELELKPRKDLSEEIDNAVQKMATKQGVFREDNLNLSLDAKCKLLQSCEQHFEREIPSYQLRYIRNLEDIVKFYIKPVPKRYKSSLPNLEQAIIDKVAPATIMLCPYIRSTIPAEAEQRPKVTKKRRKRFYA